MDTSPDIPPAAPRRRLGLPRRSGEPVSARQAEFLLDASGPPGPHAALADLLADAAHTPLPSAVPATSGEDIATVAFRQARWSAAGPGAVTVPVERPPAPVRPVAAATAATWSTPVRELLIASSRATKVVTLAVATLAVGGVALASTLSGLPATPHQRTTVAASAAHTTAVDDASPTADDPSGDGSSTAPTTTPSSSTASSSSSSASSSSREPSHSRTSTAAAPSKQARTPLRTVPSVRVLAMCNVIAFNSFRAQGHPERLGIVRTRAWAELVRAAGGVDKVVAFCAGVRRQACTSPGGQMHPLTPGIRSACPIRQIGPVRQGTGATPGRNGGNGASNGSNVPPAGHMPPLTHG